MTPSKPAAPRSEHRSSPWNEYLKSLYGRQVIVVTSDTAPGERPVSQRGDLLEGVCPSIWRGTMRLINLEHPNCVIETDEGREVTLFNVTAIAVGKREANV